MVFDFIIEEVEEVGKVCIFVNEFDDGLECEYWIKVVEEWCDFGILMCVVLIFFEVYKVDFLDFEEDLVIKGEVYYGYCVFMVCSGNVLNIIVVVLFKICDYIGVVFDVYFEWNEGNLILNMFCYFVIGIGEVVLVICEVLC